MAPSHDNLLSTISKNKCQTVKEHARRQGLTPQPFLPKLRLTKHMSFNASRLPLVALFLAIIFLGAQFHFCADLTPEPASSHICPFCTVAGSALAAEPLSMVIAPETNWLEVLHGTSVFSAAILRATSPRAPPSL